MCSRWALILGLMFAACLVQAETYMARTFRRPDGAVRRFRRVQAAPLQAPQRAALRPRTTWDADRTYRQLVVLVSFADRDFSSDQPRQRYHRIFNEAGYNEGAGPGCVADYFRVQSGGLFNVEFDVVGPVALGRNATSTAYAPLVFQEALRKLDDEVDFHDYVWDNPSQVDQVIFVWAGYGGNEDADVCDGCLWPATSAFTGLELDGVRIAQWSGSAELFSDNLLCGIGTICHEYSHCFGLPDMYPTAGSEYAVLDEWDLMDGGNYCGDGWCPCNYTLHEKMLLGWASPQLLTEACSVSGLLPVAEGGVGYQILSDAAPSTEYYLLENRQWTGWDACLPGHGLVVTHVDYDVSRWRDNTVNTRPDHHCLELFHADNADYNDCEWLRHTASQYDGLHSRILQNTAYPYGDNDQLTDTSLPAAMLYHAAEGGDALMGKPVTHIQESDGLVSFDFMGGHPSGVRAVPSGAWGDDGAAYYSPDGRRHQLPAARHGLYIGRDRHGNTKKLIR